MQLKLLIVSAENVFSDVISHILHELNVASEIISSFNLIEETEMIQKYDGMIYAGSSEESNQVDDYKVIAQIKQQIPIFGIGSGMQAIVCAFNGKVVKSKNPSFAEKSVIKHFNKGVFTDLPKRFSVVRYHAFVADQNTFPHDELMVTAQVDDDYSIMGIKHRVYPIEGVQFNPESIQTSYGKELFEAFIQRVKSTKLSYT
ncbi:gamma-glutamyl-gamma-aminobutyrate hydrolase family protein [Thiotrichales bacterium 19X7-9]|nr:gamma-glutamyl-gamma-aminobutyrate hydrolase family protein [Thiotrichales bacterium 19X7-9]